MSDAITRATEILKPTDEQFIIIAGRENTEIEVRHRFNYTQGMVMFAAMAKSLMDAFQGIGYPVHSDMRNILEGAIKMYGKQSSRDNNVAKKLMEMAGYRDDNDPNVVKGSSTEDGIVTKIMKGVDDEPNR